MRLKGCSHCGGDMYEEEMPGFEEAVCLQCGNRETIPGERYPIRHPDTVERTRRRTPAKATSR